MHIEHLVISLVLQSQLAGIRATCGSLYAAVMHKRRIGVASDPQFAQKYDNIKTITKEFAFIGVHSSSAISFDVTVLVLGVRSLGETGARLNLN